MKNIILTGASRGIGKSLFENLKKNYNVIGLSKNPQDKDKEIIQCDISKEEEVDKVFDQIKKKYKSIYSLINCAGILSTGQLINTDTLNLNKMIDVNFKGTIFCSKKALKLMLKEGKGRIINFSSIASFFPLKGDSVYSATKGAVNIFTKSLAKEVEKNITVNAIAPGFVLTDMTSTLSEEQKKLIELQTIKREITFDDILNIVIFLLSETGKSTTGQVIQVG